MKKLMTILAILLGLGIASAQTEPTLEETRDYINKIWKALPELKISDTWNFKPQYTGGFGYNNIWKTSNGGELSCKNRYRYYVNYEYQPEDFVEVVDTNPEWTIKTNGIEVGYIALKAKAKTIRVIEVGFDSWDTCQLNNTDRLFFYYNKSNPGEKERLIKALNHFIKLSKKNAKPDPFAN